MSEQLDVNYPGIEFYERDDVPFAFNPILYKCYWIYSDGSLKESPINLAELYINGRQITKAEALRLAKACGRGVCIDLDYRNTGMVETFEQYKNNLDDISGIFLSCNLFAGRSKPSLLWNRNNGYWADYYVCIVRAEVFRWPCKVMVSLTIESIPNFEGMIADLKAGLKNGYGEVQEKFWYKTPTLQEYIEKVQRRNTEILEEKIGNLV